MVVQNIENIALSAVKIALNIKTVSIPPGTIVNPEIDMATPLANNGAAINAKFRPLIAVTPDNPEVIYALYSAGDYSFHGLYKSSDSGDNWVLQSDSPNILAWETDGTGTGGQSWYDLSLGVATNNEDLVYVGGINIWKSINGGLDWDIDASSGNGSNYTYMHVDQHAFEFNPINHIAYAGNDGGFYKYMSNLNKWVDISDGLEIAQFYKNHRHYRHKLYGL